MQLMRSSARIICVFQIKIKKQFLKTNTCLQMFEFHLELFRNCIWFYLFVVAVGDCGRSKALEALSTGGAGSGDGGRHKTSPPLDLVREILNAIV